jgi:hypothetical protein
VLTLTLKEALDGARERGWILEPVAKGILREAGFDIPGGVVVTAAGAALEFAASAGFPLVAKAVSPLILHKTELNAVVTGIRDPDSLAGSVDRLLGLPGAESVLVEPMVSGVELILGAKDDYQFGPVVLLGTGGTGVELFNDVAVRMAPVTPRDVISMVESLKGRALVTGFRGGAGVDLELLADTVVRFSRFAMALEGSIESMDLNPLICTRERCVVADVRMMLP